MSVYVSRFSPDLPRPGEVAEVYYDGFGKPHLGLGVVTREVVETINQGCTKHVGQLLPMHCAHPL